MPRERLQRICELLILLLLAFTILWKGGKTLESTWLLAGVAGLCVLTQYWHKRKSDSRIDPRLELLILLFLAWTALSYVFSMTKNYGFDEVVRDSALGLLFLWHLHGQSFEGRFFRLFSRVTLASCLIGFFIYVFQPVNRFVGCLNNRLTRQPAHRPTPVVRLPYPVWRIPAAMPLMVRASIRSTVAAM